MSHPGKSEPQNLLPQSDVYRKIFHTLPTAFGLSQDGIIVDCNEAFAKLLNCKREDIIGNHITEYMCPTERGIALERIQQRRQGASVDPKIIYNMKRPDGSQFMAEAAILEVGPELDVAFVQDVTRWNESATRLASVETFRTELDAGNFHNLDQITSAAGKMMGADCAVYYRFKEGVISVAGSWQMPKCSEDMKTDKCISYAAFSEGTERCYTQKSIQSSAYAETDPIVKSTGCDFYAGQLVRDGYRPIGVLSLFFSAERKLYTTEHHFMQDMAGMLATEEERLEAEEALRQSEAKFKSYINQSIDAVFVADDTGRYLEVNPAASVITGYSGPELRRMSIADLVEPSEESLKQAMDAFDELLRDGQCRTAGKLRRKDGTVIYAEIHAAALGDGRYMGVVRDITERKRTEEELLHRTYELQAIFRAVPDLYFRIKTDGTILEYLTGGSENLYLPKEQFIGKRMQDVLPKSVGELCWSAISEASRTNSVVSIEYTLSMPEGDKYFEARMTPFIDDQVIAIIRNITEQKQSRDTVIESLTALERAYQLQSEFVRNMTHDVRTPLTSVIGYTEALLDGFAGTLTDEQRAVLKRIVGQANSLLAILEEILESAKLAAGVHKLDLKTVKLERIIGDALTLVEPAVREKGIELSTYIDNHLPMVVSDPQKLMRILNNLITNAVKFTFEGSVKISVNSSIDGVDVVITDTGTGIPEDRQDQVFDAFIQLSYPKKHKPAGTGLGLSIVAELVEVLHCSLILSSVPGIGTAFTLHIPLRLEQTRSKRARLPIS